MVSTEEIQLALAEENSTQLNAWCFEDVNVCFQISDISMIERLKLYGVIVCNPNFPYENLTDGYSLMRKYIESRYPFRSTNARFPIWDSLFRLALNCEDDRKFLWLYQFCVPSKQICEFNRKSTTCPQHNIVITIKFIQTLIRAKHQIPEYICRYVRKDFHMRILVIKNSNGEISPLFDVGNYDYNFIDGNLSVLAKLVLEKHGWIDIFKLTDERYFNAIIAHVENYTTRDCKDLSISPYNIARFVRIVLLIKWKNCTFSTLNQVLKAEFGYYFDRNYNFQNSCV